MTKFPYEFLSNDKYYVLPDVPPNTLGKVTEKQF